MEDRTRGRRERAPQARGRACVGVIGKAHAKAAESADAILGLSAAIAVAALLLTGQACQSAYRDGQAHGIAYGKAQAQQQAYDRGYADAVYELQEGDPSWARE